MVNINKGIKLIDKLIGELSEIDFDCLEVRGENKGYFELDVEVLEVLKEKLEVLGELRVKEKFGRVERVEGGLVWYGNNGEVKEFKKDWLVK